jgi:hypothetical protein
MGLYTRYRYDGLKVASNDLAVKTVYENEGSLHCLSGPAIEYVDGTQEWWVNGLLHREDGPAVIRKNLGNLDNQWYLNGQLHRENGPAVEYANGTEEWYREGKRHRIGGPAVINRDDGLMRWFQDFKYHVLGSAVEPVTFSKEWWVDGYRHRDDGPAVINADGHVEWWVRSLDENFDSAHIEIMKKCATKMFTEKKDIETLGKMPLSQIKSLLYSFNKWEDAETSPF